MQTCIYKRLFCCGLSYLLLFAASTLHLLFRLFKSVLTLLVILCCLLRLLRKLLQIRYILLHLFLFFSKTKQISSLAKIKWVVTKLAAVVFRPRFGVCVKYRSLCVRFEIAFISGAQSRVLPTPKRIELLQVFELVDDNYRIAIKTT